MSADRAAVCCHVANARAPILFTRRDEVSRPGEREWCFRCGAGPHHEEEERDWPLEAVVARDPSVVEIVQHPRGTTLERSAPGGRWHTEHGPMLFPRRPSRRFPTLEPRYPPRPGEPLVASDLEVLADVAQWGWHVVQAVDDGEERDHAFTIGLFRSFDHPEVVLFGLPPAELGAALHRIAARVRDGERFDDGDAADGVLDRGTVIFRTVARRHHAAYLGYAAWFHGGPRFPAVQCLWPDAEGNLPWERKFQRELRAAQPLLFELEPA